MNALSQETSPYLLQHADNPVDWYPWGDEAFAAAVAQDKAVLLSVGYSACHWCHVMAHESFENPETADLMNANFICIKVDREERPDIDAIYMNAVQAMTGAGGWPMTVFLTPEGKPFYGGTYFPPEDRMGYPGFRRVLLSLAELWQNRREEALQAAENLTEHLGSMAVPPAAGELAPNLLAEALQTLRQGFDDVYGGFGSAPKFPPHTALELLLSRSAEEAQEMAAVTLDNMALGGIYDQLGGGFARYSVDAVWLVPHFEKMLYDNAQLVSRYSEAYARTQNPLYARTVQETLTFLVRELKSPEGGFYSALDADSEGVEGKYYVWQAPELDALLGEDAELVKAHYGVTPSGNFEGSNILHLEQEVKDIAARFGLEPHDVRQRLDKANTVLLEVRQGRIPPGLDDKILCSWNALMLSAYAKAGQALGQEAYLQAARALAEFLLATFERDGKLLHTYKAGEAKVAGMLEDYAYLAQGLLDLYRVTLEPAWLVKALELTETITRDFYDAESGGFFSTPADSTLIVRPKDYFDSPTPSGNGAAARLLLALARYTDNRTWETLALETVRPMQEAMRRHPTGFASLLLAAEALQAKPQEVAIFGKPDDPETDALVKVVLELAAPQAALALVTSEADPLRGKLPFLEGRSMVDGKPTVYVCSGGACRLPVTTVEALREEFLGRLP